MSCITIRNLEKQNKSYTSFTNPRIHPGDTTSYPQGVLTPAKCPPGVGKTKHIMSFVRLWVHLVWGTKKRHPLLEKPQRYKIFDHIRENAKEKEIHLDHINGYVDHVHCLVSLNADQTIAKVAQLLKGESSFWVNNKTDKLLPHKLIWCDDYYAVGVSESQLPAVRKYIREQEEHHRNKTFEEECREFMDKFGFEKLLE